MSRCIQCGIPAPFYEKGYLIIRGADLKLSFDSLQYIDGRTAVLRYESIDEAKERVAELAGKTEGKIQLGLAETAAANRLYEPAVLQKRLEAKETVEFIQTGSFTSHLQPIISMKTREIHGYEALLRAKNPALSIPPAQLFETAAKTGLNSLLDQRARETAVRERANTLPAGIKSFINFLPSTIYNPEFCLQHTFEIVERYQVNPGDLVFEVVETEKIEDVNHLKSVMKRYKQEGMKVALDDVGAGFATVEMLHLLQPDYVKIDRSYISGCDTDEEKQAFLANTHKYAKELGILTLAEGIETKEEFEVCAEIGYDFAQGYFIGKPLPGSTIREKAGAKS